MDSREPNKGFPKMRGYMGYNIVSEFGGTAFCEKYLETEQGQGGDTWYDRVGGGISRHAK
jgi:hypothetical protein